MTELLNRDDETTTVSGEYRWTPSVAAFADATPVTRPAVHAQSYDLLSSFFRRQLFGSWSRMSHGEPVRLMIPTYLVAVSADDPGAMTGRPVTVALFGGYPDGPEIDLHVTALLDEGGEEPGDHPGTIALRELQEWTGLGLDALVALVGLAPSTRAYWRNNPTAPVRPTKAGRLLRLRSAVGLLVGDAGLETARLILRSEGWLDEALDDGRLGELELRVRQVLLPEGLKPPAHVPTGLSREELLARAIGDRADADAETSQRNSETSGTSYLRGDDAPEET